MQLACGVRFLAGAAAAKEPAQFVFEPSKAKEEAEAAAALEKFLAGETVVVWRSVVCFFGVLEYAEKAN